MLSNFYRDLEIGKAAEQIVKNTISSFGFTVIDVSNDRECFSKGDLLVITPTGEEHYIEVKDDSRITETQNILCEECVYYYDIGREVKGNFYSNYEIYAVVSEAAREIYFFNFSILKNIYKQGRFTTLKHSNQESDVYLLPIGIAKKAGALIKKINY